MHFPIISHSLYTCITPSQISFIFDLCDKKSVIELSKPGKSPFADHTCYHKHDQKRENVWLIRSHTFIAQIEWQVHLYQDNLKRFDKVKLYIYRK